MRNKKLFRACMTGILSAAMLLTSVPAAAAEFGDGTQVEEAVTAENPNLENADIITAPEEETAEETIEEEAEEPALFSAEASAKASSVKIDSKNFPDSAFRSYIQKTYDTDGNNTLSSAEIQNATMMDISGRKIKSLRGIDKFPYLTYLDASKNSLKGTLNLPANTRLKELNISNNALQTLNIQKCTALQFVNVSHNKFTKLAVYSKALKSLDCSYNALTSLQMPSSYNNIEYINVSHNKFTSQKSAGVYYISSSKYDALYEVDASYNSFSSFNCSGFEGILDISNNKITTLSGGSEGYQAVAIYLEGKYNTLSKTSKVDFSELGNRIPQRFTCESSVRSKIIMASPRLKVSRAADLSKVTVTVGTTSEDAACTLYRKAGSGSYTKLKTWNPGELEDPEFGENVYTDTSVKPGVTYTYKLTATQKVQDRAKNPVSWSRNVYADVKMVPSTPGSFAAKSSARKTANLSWAKVGGASGYQVYRGTSTSNMKYVRATSGTSYKNTGLSSGRTYYFKVRAYKKINGKTYYGSFCSPKAVKIK